MSIIGFVRVSDKAGMSAVNYYRSYLPLTKIKHFDKRALVTIQTSRDYAAILAHLGEQGVAAITGRHRILLLSRQHNAEGIEEFIEFVHGHGAVVVFDTDDDLTGETRSFEEARLFVEALKSVDYVTVSTPYLAKRVSRYTSARPVVLPNHVDVPWFAGVSMSSERRVPSDRIVVGFIGTASHYEDWKHPLDALKRIASEFPNVTIAVAGYKPDYLDDVENLEYFRWVDIFNYPSLMRQFDVVCCSLDTDDEFNLSKSGIKALEAMAAARPVGDRIGGAVPVCTDMPVYRRVVNNGVNGILTSNDGWYDALKAVVSDGGLRHRLAINGHKWVRKNRDINRGYVAWRRFYRSIL